VGGGADVAEYMTAQNPESLTPGDLLIVDQDSDAMVTKSDGTLKDTRIIGIVSTNPGLIAAGGEVEESKDNQVLVALAGRVPLKVNFEGGEIKKGDRLTSSSIEGEAMKATSSAYTIGIALEDFDGDMINEDGTVTYNSGGEILVFINLTYSKLSPDIKEGTVAGEAMRDLNGSDLINVGAIKSANGQWSIDASGRLIVEEIKTKRLEVGDSENPQGITIYDQDTGEEYCVGVKSGEWVKQKGKCNSTSAPDSAPKEQSPEIANTTEVLEEPQLQP
ncbi:hypothetical protein MYX76_18190, partial [Desulfobacterota bacterium AH_259_B03_O07]|nr:hypothetical protein [Desulfobacterota bacterium AH_259_B03_O07]